MRWIPHSADMKTKQTNQTGLLLLLINPAFRSIDIQHLSHLLKSLVSQLTHIYVVRLSFPRLSRKICYFFVSRANLHLLAINITKRLTNFGLIEKKMYLYFSSASWKPLQNKELANFQMVYCFVRAEKVASRFRRYFELAVSSGKSNCATFPVSFCLHACSNAKMCIDWIKNAFFKEETKVALVGLQKSGKTTFLDTVLVSKFPSNVFVSKLPSCNDRLLLWPNTSKTSLDGSQAVNMNTQDQ